MECGKLKVNEIFHSIQGEGRYAGIPMSFIRLQGCNFSDHPCSWCDTKYALDPSGGIEANIQGIVSSVKSLSRYRGSWVCITGGEPMLQLAELRELVFALRSEGYLIEIETNGVFPPPTWQNRVNSWVVDIKCPSSGNQTPLDFIPMWQLTKVSNQIKFVVATTTDLSFVEDVMKISVFIPEVFISPVLDWKNGNILNRDLVREVVFLCKSHNLRFSIQLHKLLEER